MEQSPFETNNRSTTQDIRRHFATILPPLPS